MTVFSSNYTLYADINRRITSIYLEFAPEIEEYSIDEAFLFFDKFRLSVNEWQEIGKELKQRIWKEVGMPICVGIAPTKTLAKLYNKRAKEHKAYLPKYTHWSITPQNTQHPPRHRTQSEL